MRENLQDKIYGNINYNTNEIISKANFVAIMLCGLGAPILPMLNGNLQASLLLLGANILNYIYYMFSRNSESHTKEVQKVKSLYQEFISEYAKLNKTLGLKNPIELYTFYNKMLYDGYLSRNKKFHFGDTTVRDINGIYPSNVINGEAVCRHIAPMLKDIYNAYGIEGNTLSVYQSNLSVVSYKTKEITDLLEEILNKYKRTGIPFLDLIYQYEEELNKYYEYTIPQKGKKLSRFGNHMITTAVYQGMTYYLDPTQSRVYKPSNIKDNILVDKTAVGDIRIVARHKQNKKILPTLTQLYTPFSEDQEYIDITTKIYESNKDIIEAYYQNQKELYSDIAEELAKIKVKRKIKPNN